MKNAGQVLAAYKYLLGILVKNAPMMVIGVFITAILGGLASTFIVYANSNIINMGLAIAEGSARFAQIVPFLVLFVVCSLLPSLVFLYRSSYAEPRTILVLRSAFRAEMLKKIKTMKYQHLESDASMEIIDKAYTRAETSARHMFPMYMEITVKALVGTAGALYIILSIRWWLIFPILIPFIVESILSSRNVYDVYDQLEGYWDQEKSYETLASFLKSRDYIRENRLNQASDYLIDTYKSRFNKRNRQYEKFFFRHLRNIFLSDNICRIAEIGNTIILLILYINGQLDLGTLVSVTLLIYNTLYDYGGLAGCAHMFISGYFMLNSFNYYKKYFDLSDDAYAPDGEPAGRHSIQFCDVWFRYPGTESDVLKGLSFTVNPGEKVSIVGKNGEGKSTMVKLLLGLFTPDRGEILIGGKPLESYSYDQRVALFGTVFQDFGRYSITLKENVAIGGLGASGDGERLGEIFRQAKMEGFIADLPDKENTLLGRDFEGGTDLSGGQWQRIAMARALCGDKPFLILDEPTSQLDPLAESALYSEFAQIANGKTSLFITHRLGSTAITDKIIVISGGVAAQIGTHEGLLAQGGLYADMFNAQKSWYQRSGEAI